MALITVVEFPTYLSQVGKCISEEESNELVEFLARHPYAGQEIPGTGGVRKLRFAGKGKGKRGGLRVIYYFYNETAPLFLLTVYGKGEQVDMTVEQKLKIMRLAQVLKAECKSARKK